jgi:hypothetical protein
LTPPAIKNGISDVFNPQKGHIPFPDGLGSDGVSQGPVAPVFSPIQGGGPSLSDSRTTVLSVSTPLLLEGGIFLHPSLSGEGQTSVLTPPAIQNGISDVSDPQKGQIPIPDRLGRDGVSQGLMVPIFSPFESPPPSLSDLRTTVLPVSIPTLVEGEIFLHISPSGEGQTPILTPSVAKDDIPDTFNSQKCRILTPHGLERDGMDQGPMAHVFSPIKGGGPPPFLTPGCPFCPQK